MIAPLALALLPLQAAVDEEPVSQVWIDLPAGDESFLRRAYDTLDVLHVDRAGARLEALVRASQIPELVAQGLSLDVEVADLKAFYRARLWQPGEPPVTLASGSLGQWVTPPFGQGSMGGYYTLSEARSVISQIQAAYPSIVAAPQVIGTTIEGRPIEATRVSDNPGVSEGEPEVRFDSLHHSREPMSMHATLWFLFYLVENYGTDPLATYLVDERELWFVPIVNPDGYVYNESTDPGGGGLWRKNRRNNGSNFGVDLNRNYAFQWGIDDQGSSPFTSSETYRGPSPASEPETQAMQAFMAAHDFQTALSTHSFSNVWLHAWGYTQSPPANLAQYVELSALQTEFNGYPAGPGWVLLGYLANGTTSDYDQGIHGTLSWVPEIGAESDGFWPATDRIVPLAMENLAAFQRTALGGGAYLHGTATPSDTGAGGDGDGFFEAGEAVELSFSVRNSGRLAPGTTTLVRVSTASPFASVSVAQRDLGSVPSFGTVDTGAQPLVLDLDPSAPSGTEIAYTLEIEAEGYVQTQDAVLTVGIPIRLVADDLEGDFGWTAGVPGDGATTGLWVRADPAPTTWEGAPLAPGDDASDPGTMAYVTGNDNSSAGSDDVDGGPTTLVSPPVDLANVQAAYLGYQRWWANLGGVTNDDELVVELSTDGGSSWLPVETVTTTANQWISVSFRAENIGAPTDDVRVRFVASDDPNNSLTEAGIDELEVVVYDDRPRLLLFGRQGLGQRVSLNVSGQPGDAFVHLVSAGTGSLTLPGQDEAFQLDPLAFYKLSVGTIPGSRARSLVIDLPTDPTLAGATVYFQTLVGNATGAAFTNLQALTF